MEGLKEWEAIGQTIKHGRYITRRLIFGGKNGQGCQKWDFKKWADTPEQPGFAVSVCVRAEFGQINLFYALLSNWAMGHDTY